MCHTDLQAIGLLNLLLSANYEALEKCDHGDGDFAGELK